MKSKMFRRVFRVARVCFENENQITQCKRCFMTTPNLRETPAEAKKVDQEPKKVEQEAKKVEPQAKKVDDSQTKNKSFVMNLFRGQVVGEQVFPFPILLNQEQRETLQMLVDPARKFLEEVNNPAKNDTDEKVDEKILKDLWGLGVFGLQVPLDLGGLGLTNTQYTRLVEIVGANDLGVAITLGAHQSIGFKGILLSGTPEQKKKYLPRVTSGQYAAFCLTEPSAGSDAASIKSKAVPSPDGKHFILNGSKIWISNGGMAEIMTVFAQTPVPDAKTGQTVDKVTAFIVERAFGGVTNGSPEKKMGIKASNTAEVYYDNVKIPVENVLGGVGNGFKVAMSILNNGRFGMAAGLSGTMRWCIKKAVDFATQRKQFGQTIDRYGAIQEKIAHMSMLQYVTESMAYMISGNMDSGSEHYHLEAAISKCFASEAAWYVCDEAIQILGGMGYMKETGLERVLRDLRIFRIFEGTNDILRLFVALTGLQYAGSHLKELQNAVKDPSANLGLIFNEALKRLAGIVGMASLPAVGHLVHEDLNTPAHILATKVAAFGRSVEMVLIKYGKNIINEQFVLNRLANAAMDIYATAAALSRASNSLNTNLPSAVHEKLMVEAWTLEAGERIDHNLRTIGSRRSLDNFKKLSEISQNTCSAAGVVQLNPLNF